MKKVISATIVLLFLLSGVAFAGGTFVDPQTGDVYQKDPGGAINTRTGQRIIEQPNNYLNPRTGEVHPKGSLNPPQNNIPRQHEDMPNIDIDDGHIDPRTGQFYPE